jgi:GNAT superfamily N-acetyltransferase
MPAQLVPLSEAKVPEASASLADAFYDDPLSRFMFPGEQSRTKWLRLLHRAHLRLIMPEGHVYAVGEGGVAGTIGLLPPGGHPLPLGRTLRYLASLTWRLPSGGFPLGKVVRALQAQHLIDRLHIREPHWYVSVLGVHPASQGTGLGRALLDTPLAWADRDRLPTYLETANERNLTFYRRFGFEVVQQVDTPGGGPPIWTMLRPPVG